MLFINEKKKILRIILFSIYNLILINCYNCNDFEDCFNCSMCGDERNAYCNCIWNSESINPCMTEIESRELSDWYTELLQCKGSEDQALYCSGEDTIFSKDDLNSDDSLTFQIQKDSRGNYGKKWLFCYFNYIDDSINDYKLNIHFIDSSPNKPIVAYGCSSNGNGRENIKIIEEGREEITCSKSYNIFFMALLKTQYETSPVSFQIKLKTNNMYKYITAFSIAIVFILIITCIICCITRYFSNKARRKIRILMNERARENMIRIQQENNNMENYFGYNENLEEINKEKLDRLFQTKMAEHLYKSEYNQYGGGCSICLENFKKKSKVSMTPCSHVFHYNCIKDWLFKNAKNPKCPNCNKEVLVNEDIINNGKTNDAKTIRVKKKLQNNNILNNNLNFGGRNSVNNIALTINRGRGDSSQSTRQYIGDY